MRLRYPALAVALIALGIPPAMAVAAPAEATGVQFNRRYDRQQRFHHRFENRRWPDRHRQFDRFDRFHRFDRFERFNRPYYHRFDRPYRFYRYDHYYHPGLRRYDFYQPFGPYQERRFLRPRFHRPL
jgi:hypothetical protein